MTEQHYNFKISFHYIDINWWDGTKENEEDVEIISDILLLNDNFMIINDLSNTYIHEWDLHGISNLKIEKIRRK